MKAFVKEFIYRNKTLLLSVALTVPVVVFDLIFDFIKLSKNTMGVLLGVGGGLAGFMLTGLALFFALPYSDNMKKRINDTRYNIIVPRALWFGIIIFILSLFLFILFPKLPKVNGYLFIAGLFQTVLAARSLYIMCLKCKV